MPCLFRPGLPCRCFSPAQHTPTRIHLRSVISFNLLSSLQASIPLPPVSPFALLAAMPSPTDQDNNTGAASSAPADRGSSSRSARPLLSRNFNRIFGGSQSRSTVPLPAKECADPLGTLGAPTARASRLEGAHFAGWARRSRCNLSYSMLEVLGDDAWDFRRVSQVTSGLNGAQRALVRFFQGAYQIPHSVRCDRAFVRDPNAAGSIVAASAFLFRERRRCRPHVAKPVRGLGIASAQLFCRRERGQSALAGGK